MSTPEDTGSESGYGAAAEGTAPTGSEANYEDPMGVQVNVATDKAEVGLQWDDKGEYGAFATFDRASVEVGVGDPDGDPTSNADLHVKASVSDGDGAGIRVIWGADQDGDGALEYGIEGAYDAYGGGVRLEDGVIREEVGYAKEAFNQAGQALDDATQSFTEDVTDAAEWVAETANDAWDTVTETASNAWDTVTSWVSGETTPDLSTPDADYVPPEE